MLNVELLMLNDECLKIMPLGIIIVAKNGGYKYPPYISYYLTHTHIKKCRQDVHIRRFDSENPIDYMSNYSAVREINHDS